MTFKRLRGKLLLPLISIQLFFAYSIQAQTEAFSIDYRHSEIGFSINIAGGLSEVLGSFEKFSGTIEYDPKDILKMKTLVNIDPASINTGVDGRDNHLRDEDFFDVKKYPELKFESQSVSKQKDGFVLNGILTMHGTSKRIQINFIRKHNDPIVVISGRPTIVFSGTSTIKRSNFGIKSTASWNQIVEATGEMAMSDEVVINLKIIADK